MRRRTTLIGDRLNFWRTRGRRLTDSWKSAHIAHLNEMKMGLDIHEVIDLTAIPSDR